MIILILKLRNNNFLTCDIMIPNLKDIVADLLNAPDRVKFKELLKNNLEEFNEIEFKGDYIEYDKIAKHILAMANTDNGLIIIGVDEKNNELNPRGIELRDKTDIKNKLANILPDLLEYEIFDFKYDNHVEWDKVRNKNFQMIAIYFTPEKIPFLSKIEKNNVKPFEIYCRRSNSSDKVRQEDINRILDTRINSFEKNVGFNLRKELDDLKTLTIYSNSSNLLAFSITNPLFLDIIQNLQEKKIKRIEKGLNIENMGDGNY